uniref:Uncharacterized protein n=1 Tax=Molossus molossus TaxID=27622 RepID=A0A7J8BNK6_MOLMO|nr:hypothetical protein HJG59_010129 [Molossus molossus]
MRGRPQLLAIEYPSEQGSLLRPIGKESLQGTAASKRECQLLCSIPSSDTPSPPPYEVWRFVSGDTLIIHKELGKMKHDFQPTVTDSVEKRCYGFPLSDLRTYLELQLDVHSSLFILPAFIPTVIL